MWSPATSHAGSSVSQVETIVQALTARADQDFIRNSCRPLVLTREQINAPWPEFQSATYALLGHSHSDYQHYLFHCRMAGIPPMRLALLLMRDPQTITALLTRIRGLQAAMDAGNECPALLALILDQVRGSHVFARLAESSVLSLLRLVNGSGDLPGYASATDTVRRNVMQLEREYGQPMLRSEPFLELFLKAQVQPERSTFYKRLAQSLGLVPQNSMGTAPLLELLKGLDDLTHFRTVLYEQATPERPADPRFKHWLRVDTVLRVAQQRVEEYRESDDDRDSGEDYGLSALSAPVRPRPTHPAAQVAAQAAVAPATVPVAPTISRVCSYCTGTSHTLEHCRFRKRDEARYRGPQQSPVTAGPGPPRPSDDVRMSTDARPDAYNGGPPRPQGAMVCHNCQELGHRAADCTRRLGRDPVATPVRSPPHSMMAPESGPRR